MIGIPYQLERGCAFVGMFDKDKEIGTPITDLFPLSESDTPESSQFVLWAATVDKDKVETEIGLASKTRLIVSEIGSDGESDRTEVTTLASAIADKAAEAEPGDFPAVVKLMQVPSKKFGGTALVVQFVREYKPRSASEEFDAATAAMADEDQADRTTPKNRAKAAR